jgi:hypothetical protein
MTGKDQRQLREMHRQRASGQDEFEEETTRTHQAEGERSGEPARKATANPDQAEGDRETVEHEIRSREEKDR